MINEKKKKKNSADLNIILAVINNIISWFVNRFFPSLLPHLLPKIDEEDDDSGKKKSSSQTKCIAISRPGGKEQLRVITLKPGYVTCGYNINNKKEDGGTNSPFVFVGRNNNNNNDDTDEQLLPPNTVIVRIHAFSINYADCCIRWGLYESANQYVGYPIVPGFDIAGIVERVSKDGNENKFKAGDRVYGATFFGAYSTRVLVPQEQLRKIPEIITSFTQAASIPAVSITALYILHLGGQFSITTDNNNNNNTNNDTRKKKKNVPILIHSCAGGVGSMLVQMSKLLSLSPVVGVVGRSSKVDAAKSLGCDVVIDKSSYNNNKEQSNCWWNDVKKAVSTTDGYQIIADSNGVSTLQKSYDHLCPTGRLITYGFHSNLPLGQDSLHPWNWMHMIYNMLRMPKLDMMDLVQSNKSVMGFNLSFFVDRMDTLNILYDQIDNWLLLGNLQCPRINEMYSMEEVPAAHELIQSGKSIGKIVIQIIE